MLKSYEYAVLIGRFQPIHNGHIALFNYATEIANEVIIVIGSNNASISIRNPWTTKDRELFIRNSVNGNFSVTAINDSAYNFNDWLLKLQQKVSVITGGKKTAIVGHYRDDTSYYLDYFPQWDVKTLPAQARDVSSTIIREACFEGHADHIKDMVSIKVYNKLVHWMTTDTFKSLLEEYQFIKSYKKRWEIAPYPPVFVTADAVVMALGHVLMIRRGRNPGKGKLALPGGFINQTETIENACLRELKEETKLEIDSKELKGALKKIKVFDQSKRDPRGRIITHAFMFELNVKKLPNIKSGDDAAEVFWFPLFQLEDKECEFFSDHGQIIKYFINHME